MLQNLNSLDNINLNSFQKKILDMIVPIMKNVDDKVLSSLSFVKGTNASIDIVLNHLGDDSLVIFSIEKDILKINSRDFDFLFFDNMNLSEIADLTLAILSGDYKVKCFLGKDGEIVKKEVVFNNHNLGKFNQTNKMLSKLFKKVYNQRDLCFSSFFKG